MFQLRVHRSASRVSTVPVEGVPVAYLLTWLVILVGGVSKEICLGACSSLKFNNPKPLDMKFIDQLAPLSQGCRDVAPLCPEGIGVWLPSARL